MQPKNDGGPYHPCECECLGDGRIDGIQTGTSRFIHTGASLRDHFAGLAMQGIVSSISSEDEYQRIKALARSDGITVSQWISRDSYKQADAMLVEKERWR